MRNIIYLSTVAGLSMLGVSAYAGTIPEVAAIRKTFADFRKSVTVDNARSGKLLTVVDKKVEQNIIALRQRLTVKATRMRQQLKKSGVRVKKYLPSAAKLDGSVDYKTQLQKAFNDNKYIIISGNGNPKQPLIYGTSPGLVLPAGHQLLMQPGAVLKRLPGKKMTLILKSGAAAFDVIIDGNKQDHWPKFQNLGKHDGGIDLKGNNFIVGCYVYNTPGTGFESWTNGNIIWKCQARNCGYIDIKFKADFYQSKWDRWSGDAFYLRGRNNLLMDSKSFDCFRWAGTTCHERSGEGIYINLTMENQLWRTYGFIDIEDCHDDKVGSMLLNCSSRQGAIGMSSFNPIAWHCSAERISVYNADDAMLLGCKTFGSGLAVGGWSSIKNAYVRGGNSPIVIGNVINKNHPQSGMPLTSDWSFTVYSANKRGIVVNNVLNEYKGKLGKGTGMELGKVQRANNRVNYGASWIKASKKTASKAAVSAKQRMLQQQMRDFGQQIPQILKKLKIAGKVTRIVFADANAKFIKDSKRRGEKEQWFIAAKRPAGNRLKPIFTGSHWDGQYGKYHGYAWYFTQLKLTGDDKFVGNRAILLFGGVDSRCKVYLNGKFIGKHEGWKEAFSFEIPYDLIHWEATELNNLTIEVNTDAGMGGIYKPIALLLIKN